MEMNKKKIGILTLNGYSNYGNRLQNLALQNNIQSLGFVAETILVYRKRNLSDRKKRITSMSKLLEKITKRLRVLLAGNIINQRQKIFIEFTKKYILETSFVLSQKDCPENLLDKYDFFIVGSDQVWNPNNLHGTSFFFLTFAENKKRISYAASFGIAELPAEWEKKYREWLSDFSYISVREDSGANIVKDITGRNAEVHLDPTMLLTKEDWLGTLETKFKKPDKDYILMYFLGKLTSNVRSKINAYAKENDLDIIELNSKKDKEVYLYGPSEFVHVINSAKLVITDSFHGAAFSITLQTPFVVFKREGDGPEMFSRINTLLNKFEMSDRIWEENILQRNILELDFSNSVTILKYERDRSEIYLKTAMGISKTE
jgi:hypothetical protein